MGSTPEIHSETREARSFPYYRAVAVAVVFLMLPCCTTRPPVPPALGAAEDSVKKPAAYNWTNDHMQVGVRWQPFGLPGSESYEAQRPVIARDSSYVQFWVSWQQAEPSPENTDYSHHISAYLKSIDQAVDECVKRGLKVELVFWHCPAWASQSGKAGPWKPKRGLYKAFATRMARHFKGRVESYQLHHEANLKSMMEDGDIDFLISEIFMPGAKAIRAVYNESPATPVLISPGGTSPCEACPALAGLRGKGAQALEDFYERLASNRELMGLVDGLNLNVSDQLNGYGMMDGGIIKSTWDHYDLVRDKLAKHGRASKGVFSSESWIVWDGSGHAADVNGDGRTDERDAYDKAITILGKCLERGLNTINLPWSDNASPWSMGLTKRRDYNGWVKSLDTGKVLEASDGGPDILAEKIDIQESNGQVRLVPAPTPFKKKDYANPRDPNHLHYYIWKWYAQIAGGNDEVIRHALSGERGNDIIVEGTGWTGKEQYKISSWNRTERKFIVLIYSDGANHNAWTRVTIPATIQSGKLYNNHHSRRDFRGEGFSNGTRYQALVITENIQPNTGASTERIVRKSEVQTVTDGQLTIPVTNMRKFTTIQVQALD